MKVLVVDNDIIMLKLMSNLLKRHHHEVVTASDGFEALQRLKDFNPDIIFTDLVMPRITGDKLSRAIREMSEFKETYIVIVSGVIFEEDPDIDQLASNEIITKGAFNETAKHILTAIENSKKKSRNQKVCHTPENNPFQLKQSVKELLEYKEQILLILRNMHEGVCELSAENAVIYANQKASDIFNEKEEKLLTLKYTDLFNGFSRKRVERFLSEKTSKNSLKVCSGVKIGNHVVNLRTFYVSTETSVSKVVLMEDITKRHRFRKMFTNILFFNIFLLVLISYYTFLHLHDFLAITHLVESEITVIDRCINLDNPRFRNALINQQNTKFLITGTEKRVRINERELSKNKVPSERIVPLNTPDVIKDRTYSSAVAVRKWMKKQKDLRFDAINVFSRGPHARRSWLLYRIAFKGEMTDIGIRSFEPSYDSEKWWSSSEGVRTTINETIAYLYAKLVFSPGHVYSLKAAEKSE